MLKSWRQMGLLLLSEFQHGNVFLLSEDSVFSGLIHKLKMPGKILYIYVYNIWHIHIYTYIANQVGIIWWM